MAKLRDFLRISEAAEYLGVSPNTLRNWERAGKIVAHRHPVNRYRLFRQQDLDALLSQVERTARRDRTNRPSSRTGRCRAEGEHGISPLEHHHALEVRVGAAWRWTSSARVCPTTTRTGPGPTSSSRPTTGPSTRSICSS